MMTSQKCPRCGVEIAATEAQGKFDGVCPKCLVDSVFGTPFLPTQIEKTAPMPAVGGEFGNYVILGVLGSGGMGVVYKARQKGLERTVALKVLPAGKDAPAELVERFFREARLAAQLQHPNIVPIHEVASQEGAYFYSMDLVEGTTLSEFLKKRGLASREAVEIVWKVAQAVDYAHEKGVLHRDLKPANVMVDRAGEPKVLDFGIAKSMSTHSGVTTTGSALGTPPYMSPEQAAGAKNLDARADVYSLGAILYEALTGRPPHTGETAMEVYRKIATEEPARPSKAPRDLQVICLKALEKEKRNRYDSAKAFAEDLRCHLDGQPIAARPASRARSVLRFARRHAAALLLGTLLTATVGTLVWMSKIKITDPLKSVGDSLKKAGEEFGKGWKEGEQLAATIDHAQRTLEMARFGTSPKERAERWKKLEAERAELTKAIEARSEAAELYYWRGRVDEALDREEEAIADYSEALKRDPELADARCRRVMAHYRRNVPQDPEETWDVSPEALETMKEDVAVLERSGSRPAEVAMLKGVIRFTRYAREFLEAVSRGSEPSIPEVRSEFEALDQALAEACRTNPASLEAFLLRGLLPPLHKGDDISPFWRERAGYLDRALSIDPNDARCYRTRSRIRAGLGDWGGALADADVVIELRPSSGEGYIQKARLFSAMSLHRLVQEDLDTAIARDPKEANGFLERALGRLYALGSLRALRCADHEYLQSAMKDLDTAVALEKKAGSARMVRAIVRKMALGDETGAEEDLKEWKRAHPRHPLTWRVPEEQFLASPPEVLWMNLTPYFPVRNSVKDEAVREGCLAYARSLCGRIQAGDDRTALVPRIAALLERAFETGAERLTPEFEAVKDEPAVRAIVEKYAAYSHLAYPILWPAKRSSNPEAAAQEMAESVRQKIASVGVKDALVFLRDTTTLVIRIPRVDRAHFDACKEVLRRGPGKPPARLELKVVASKELQERWSKDPSGSVPEGFEVVEHEGKRILVRRQAVVTGADVSAAVARAGSSNIGPPCYVDIRLTDEGAWKFDQAAAELHHQEPSLRGAIAILLDGKVLAAPTVNSEKFHGSMELAGNWCESEAGELAERLRMGPNHARLGEPEEERWVELKEK